MMKKNASVLFVCSLAMMVVISKSRADVVSTDWRGLYIQTDLGVTSGLQGLYLDSSYFRDFPLYELSLSGDVTKGATIGYHFQIGQSRFYISPEMGAYFGTVKGSFNEMVPNQDLGFDVDYRTKNIYLLSIQVGYVLNLNTLLTFGVGLAGADMKLCGSVYYSADSTKQCVEGYAPGLFESLGIEYDVGKGWSIGGEVQSFAFKSEKRFDNTISLNAKVRERRLAITVTKRF